MNQTKLSSRIYQIVKAAAAAAVLPVMFIYVMVAKPDYHIMNAMSHVVVPVATWIGDIVTWPIRAVGGAIVGVGEISNLKAENEELRVRLDEALANKDAYEIAIKENQKLARELGVVRARPQKVTVADITLDNSAMGNNTFLINRGANDDIEPSMAVVSMDNRLVGVVIDAAPNFARVRSLTDTDTNIAVRVVGSEVYGFMRGDGSARPNMGFFSDQEFQPAKGIKLVTSNISGVLPEGLLVGEMADDTDVNVLRPNDITRVMVLHFDTDGKYK